MSDFKDYLNSVNSEIDWLERPEGHSWGLWRANIDRILEYFFPESSTDLISENNYSLSEFQLYQNYPNPFNSTSIISYSIPKSSQVSIKIFNTLGEEIETLVNEEKAVGTYELTWNAANIPSEVYFYRLQAGDFVQTRKMILLK